MNLIIRRLLALEARNAPSEALSQPPFWSESHGCDMQNHGGFILPSLISDADEWERIASKQQDSVRGVTRL